jgi:hypothetical protein
MKRVLLPLMLSAVLALPPASGPAEQPEEDGAAGAETVLYEQALKPYPLLILVPVKAGAKICPFVLDTGTNALTVDATMIKDLGPVKFTKRGVRSGAAVASGKEPAYDFYDSPGLTIGTWQTPAIPVTALDLEGVRNSTGRDVRGLLSSNLLSQRALSLDFDRAKMKIVDGGLSWPGMTKIVKLDDRESRGPRVTLPLEGYPIEFLIDIGNESCVQVDSDTFSGLEFAGIIVRAARVREQYATVSGTTNYRAGHFLKGELMGMDLKGMPVDEAATNAIGLRLLVNFNSVIDFKGRSFCYTPRRVPPPIWPLAMLGMDLVYSSGRNRVDYLEAKSAAAEAGIRIADRIIRMGPLREAEMNTLTLYDLCLNHAEELFEVDLLRPGQSSPITTHLQLPKKIYIFPPRMTGPN